MYICKKSLLSACNNQNQRNKHYIMKLIFSPQKFPPEKMCKKDLIIIFNIICTYTKILFFVWNLKVPHSDR